jgi:hypothetical protein
MRLKLIGGAVFTGALVAAAVVYTNRTVVVDIENLASISAVTPTPSPLPTRLPNPPAEIKAIYFTSWSAGTPRRVEEAIRLIKDTELNAIVINIKEETGTIAFQTESPLIKSLGAEEVRIADFPALVNRLHREGIYVIARIAVFQDQHLVRVRPDLAVKDQRTGGIWRDRKGLAWVDPASREAWGYTVEIAKQAIRLGVDEVNFDYIRFPSDGNIAALRYPIWKSGEASRREVLRSFFAYLRGELAPLGTPLSADLFGLSTVNTDDLGIGQVLEDALPYFEFVSPMVYPSHYASGFLGYQNPAAYPYEVVKYSLDHALRRRTAMLRAAVTATSTDAMVEGGSATSVPALAQIRPWLQAFDLGAVYTPEMVRKQMRAVYDAGLTAGWYLWNPANRYSAAALLPEPTQ